MTEIIPWWKSPEFLFGASLVGGTVLLSLLLWAVHRLVRGRDRSLAHAGGWRGWFQAALPPLQFAAWYYCAYLALPAACHFLHPAWQEELTHVLHHYLWHLGLVVSVFWFLYRMVTYAEVRLTARVKPGRIESHLYPVVAMALRTLIPVFAVGTVLDLFPFPEETQGVLHKALAVAFILGVAWVLQGAILAVERAILGEKEDLQASDFSARAVQTRVRILRKFAVVFVWVIAFAAVLLCFKEVRSFGGSILASAGMAGIVLSFAAQKTLGTFFSGLQVALTQPIRLGDSVIVQGESGTVEEITLTYVVIRIWDLRRLVVPIGTFIDQPFQNLTRASTNLITTVKIRADFSLPLDGVRAEMKRWIAAAPQWDQQVYAFQVTDSDAASMELRIIASAPSSGAAFDLQCAIRERLLTYIHQNHPESLPRARQESVVIGAAAKQA